MTEKLYYADSHLHVFTARVLSCAEIKGRWEVILDRTAFFPEGGGQPGDSGILGGVRVLDTHEMDGEVVHWCDGPLSPGDAVEGRLDWEIRFARMQIHSSEHLVSGTAHREWGCENVGFHMTERGAVIDFDREIGPEQLSELERMANRAVWDNLPFHILWPTPEELEHITFRQKKELTGAVRLVEVPGVDCCACCAPHVSFSGEIGLIRLTDMMRHRGGVRLTVLAGQAAWEDAARQGAAAAELSHLFSVPRDRLPEAAKKLLGDMDDLKRAMADMERRYTALAAERQPATEGDILLFESGELSGPALRSLAEALKEKAGGVCAVFAGDDQGGWRYVLASNSTDLRSFLREMNVSLRGRGGGSAAMAQGSVTASRHQIEEFFHGKSQ